MSEPLHAFFIRNEKIVIAVTSNGCTEAAHFRLVVVSGIAGYMLTVERTEPDNCRMIPHVREFELDLPAEIADQPITVQNPFAKGPRWLGLQPAEPPRE